MSPASGFTSSPVKSPLTPSRLPSAVAVTNGWASTVTPCRMSCRPSDGALLAEEAGVGPANVGPGVGVAGALHDAGDVESPGLRTASGIAEALEGNPDLDLVAPIGEPALRLPGEIGVLVDASGNEAADLAGALASHPVGLDTQRVDGEEECAAPVVEGVEVEDDVVVVVDVVPVGDGGTDGGRVPVVRR